MSRTHVTHVTHVIHLLAALALIGAGCGAAARLGVTTGTATTAAAAAPAAAPAPATPAATSPATPAVSSAGPGRLAGDAGEPTPVAGDVRLVVPDVIGKTPDEARAIIKAAGFTQEVEIQESLSCEGAPREPGRINCQDPEAGKQTNSYAMVRIKVFTPRERPGQDYARELHKLHGMTVEAALQRLKELGHVGRVKVRHLDQYRADCGQNKVCYYSPRIARDVNEDLALWVNRPVEIAAPAP